LTRLELENDGGAARVGFVHYNTGEEIDRLLDELARLE
jgi:selenocysteine lyase/cysteine desulfurase